MPLIQFRGKRSREKKTSDKKPAPAKPSAAPAPPPPPPMTPEEDRKNFSAFFGRTKLADAEIDAIESGGASLLD